MCLPKANNKNINDANTSKRLLINAETITNVTRKEQNIIDRFATIFDVISNGHENDTHDVFMDEIPAN